MDFRIFGKSAQITVTTERTNNVYLREYSSNTVFVPHSVLINDNKIELNYNKLWESQFELTIENGTVENTKFDSTVAFQKEYGGAKLVVKPYIRLRGVGKIGNIIAKPFAKALFNYGWKTVFNMSREVIAVCQYLADEAKNEANLKAVVCPIPIDPKTVPPIKELKLKHPSVCIIQNHQIKQKSEALVQFAEVIEKLPEVTFYVSKGLPENRSFKPHQKVIDRLSKLKNVELVDINVSNKYDYLTASDIYILATGLDCTPATILEAGLAGKPVLASKVGGVPEMIVEGKTGWTIENGNADDWVNKINLLIKDDKLCQKMGSDNRDHILKEYGIEPISKKLFSIISG
jgi:glycosyltransferase involved in cell wall biosynthesis